eukprot:TRINITY_DN14055_c0_g1_i1.p1 TRINITY_DN14055_c0_g1~~TRINITY_DN14055_c0_g1_i1.p1  ORF type:complete len:482 (-),score=60.57 TRINITY_DN14055_c0_g1_i1:85-1530(-)
MLCQRHPSSHRFAFFFVGQVIPILLCLCWRCVVNTHWFRNEPAAVQDRLLQTMAFTCMCFYISHDCLYAPSNARMIEAKNEGRMEKGCIEWRDLEKATSWKELYESNPHTALHCVRQLQDVVIDVTSRAVTVNSAVFSVWPMVYVLISFIAMTSHVVTFHRAAFFVILNSFIALFTTHHRNTLLDINDSHSDGLYFSNYGRLFFVCNSLVACMIAHHVERSSRSRFKARYRLETIRVRIESILNTLMPPRVIEELQDEAPGTPPPTHRYEHATIAQSDLCGFTQLASTRAPREVVEFVGQIFGLFDDLTNVYEVYKVETVGDAYIAGQAGWPLTQRNCPISVVHFGLEMIDAVHRWARERGEDVSCRVGVHTGTCIGGIVGMEMMRYHLFGGLMTVLDLIESTSEKGRVQVSATCQEAVMKQMRREGKRANEISIAFEPRREPHLSTSKNEVVHYHEVGGDTYLARKTAAHSYPQGVRGGF